MSDSAPNQAGLVSGGNPQIPKGDGRGPVRAYLDAMPDWKGTIGGHVDRLVCQVVDDVQMAVRWNTPFYGVAGNEWFLGMHCFTKYVKVTFLNGAELQPEPPERGKQAEPRSIHLFENSDVDEEQLRDWMRQAAALPGQDLF